MVSWQRVIILGLLVSGCIGALAFGYGDVGHMLAGAAVTQGVHTLNGKITIDGKSERALSEGDIQEIETLLLKAEQEKNGDEA